MRLCVVQFVLQSFHLIFVSPFSFATPKESAWVLQIDERCSRKSYGAEYENMERATTWSPVLSFANASGTFSALWSLRNGVAERGQTQEKPASAPRTSFDGTVEFYAVLAVVHAPQTKR